MACMKRGVFTRYIIRWYLDKYKNNLLIFWFFLNSVEAFIVGFFLEPKAKQYTKTHYEWMRHFMSCSNLLDERMTCFFCCLEFRFFSKNKNFDWVITLKPKINSFFWEKQTNISNNCLISTNFNENITFLTKFYWLILKITLIRVGIFFVKKRGLLLRNDVKIPPQY